MSKTKKNEDFQEKLNEAINSGDGFMKEQKGILNTEESISPTLPTLTTPKHPSPDNYEQEIEKICDKWYDRTGERDTNYKDFEGAIKEFRDTIHARLMKEKDAEINKKDKALIGCKCYFEALESEELSRKKILHHITTALSPKDSTKTKEG